MSGVNGWGREDGSIGRAARTALVHHSASIYCSSSAYQNEGLGETQRGSEQRQCALQVDARDTRRLEGEAARDARHKPPASAEHCNHITLRVRDRASQSHLTTKLQERGRKTRAGEVLRENAAQHPE
jgi:hypothetical protein